MAEYLIVWGRLGVMSVFVEVVTTCLRGLLLGAFIVLGVSPAAATNTRYSKCLNSLLEHERPNNALDPILTEVARAGFAGGKRWNINGPYDENAINFVIPRVSGKAWSDRNLLQTCLNAATPVRCAAFASESSVICNPAFGAQVFAPEIAGPAFNVQTILAARFVVTTILAHEIAHLVEEGGENVVRHFYDFESKDGLKCYQRNGTKTDEERADDHGLALACRALQASDHARSLPTNPGDMLGTVYSVLRKLDFSYYDIDDVCVGDHNYPSISRRKHTFALKYAECAYPGSITARIVPEMEASLFARLEAWLRNRQITGHAATGEFGSKPLYDHVVVPIAPDSLLTVDRTGTSEIAIWRTMFGSGRELTFERIWHRPEDAAVLKVIARTPQKKIDIVLRSTSGSPAPRLEILTVSCAPRGPCTITARTQTFPASQQLHVGADGSALLVSPNKLAHVADIREMFDQAAPASIAAAIPDEPIVISSRNAAALFAPTKDQRAYRVLVPAGRQLRIRLLDLGNLGEAKIIAGAYSGNRLLLSLTLASPRVPLKEGPSLLDCPADMLSAAVGEVRCQLFAPPPTDLGSLQLATRDLSAAGLVGVEEMSTCPTLLAIRHHGLVWILDRSRSVADWLPANGIIDCSQTEARIYRARRVDTVRLQLRQVIKADVAVKLTR